MRTVLLQLADRGVEALSNVWVGCRSDPLDIGVQRFKDWLDIVATCVKISEATEMAGSISLTEPL